MSHRQRCVRPELWSFPPFLKLHRPARLLYLELVSLADDFGRLQATPVAVWRARYVDDEDHGLEPVTRSDVAAMLAEIEEAGLLQRHQIAGDTVGYLVGWSDAGHPAYQYISNKGKSRLPPNPTEALRRPSARSAEDERRPSADPPQGVRTDQDQESDQDSEQDSEDLHLPAREALPVVEAEPEPEAPRGPQAPRSPPAAYIDGPMALNPRAAQRLGVGGGDRPLSSEPDFMQVQAVLHCYRDHHPSTFRLPATASSPEVQAIRARLESYSVRDLVRAINAAHSRPWHQGQNASGQKYLRLTTMLGSNQVVAELLELADTPPETIQERQNHARPPRPTAPSRAAQAAQRARDLDREEAGGPPGDP